MKINYTKKKFEVDFCCDEMAEHWSFFVYIKGSKEKELCNKLCVRLRDSMLLPMKYCLFCGEKIEGEN